MTCTFQHELDSICSDYKNTTIFGHLDQSEGGQAISAIVTLSSCLIDSSTCSPEQRALLDNVANNEIYTKLWAQHKQVDITDYDNTIQTRVTVVGSIVFRKVLANLGEIKAGRYL